MVNLILSHVVTPLGHNERVYFDWLISAVGYSSPNATIEFKEGLSGYHVTVTTRGGKHHRKDIIHNVLNMHHRWGVKIYFSKSLNLSKKVYYFLPFVKKGVPLSSK